MKPKRRGFTLMELLIALSLSSLILIAVMAMATSMIRHHMEGSVKGSITGENLYGLMRMNRELQDAHSLVTPAVGNSNVVSGCVNYSRQANWIIDPSRPVTSFYYCVANIGSPPTPALLRYQSNACPMPAPSCGSGSYEVMARGFYQNPACASYFSRADDAAGIGLCYAVGNPLPTTNVPVPRTTLIQTKISMDKSFNSPND